MWFRSFLKSLKSRPSVATFRRSRHPCTARLAVEALDDRCLPSTFTVTNLLDSGAGSLRAAVAAANASPGADTIDFATTGTIALTSSQLNITDSLTINGPGAGALTVSGSGMSRVFGIAGDPTVVIADLTVANGATIDSPGGGISVAGGTVTLDHVTVTGNVAYGAPYVTGYDGGNGLGGGLSVAGGSLTLNQCIVSGNDAQGGYGIDGFVIGGAGGEGAGGGLYVVGGMVYVNQSTISGNHAVGGSGGSGYSYDGPNGTGGNGGFGVGGGIYVAAGMVEFSQSAVSDNTAFGGSGGFGDYYGYAANGGGIGGGICIAYAVPPLADLDTFTESNTVNNFADDRPNIAGPYS